MRALSLDASVTSVLALTGVLTMSLAVAKLCNCALPVHRGSLRFSGPHRSSAADPRNGAGSTRAGLCP